ncbi:MAG: hypothetical protein ACRDRU_19675 [Pseudonocardiaceae bacterium]
MSDLPEVLFVCVHNAGRSQMAAALLHHHAQGKVLVRSAGSAPAEFPQIGICRYPLSHRTRRLPADPFLLAGFGRHYRLYATDLGRGVLIRVGVWSSWMRLWLSKSRSR